MLQVIACSCHFWRKCNFACKRPKSKMKMLIVSWGVQETRCYEIYTTRHGKASLFQSLWSDRCAIHTFDVCKRSLRGSMFCLCRLQLGLAVTGARAEHFEKRIHGVSFTSGRGKALLILVWGIRALFSCFRRKHRTHVTVVRGALGVGSARRA